jgi:multidrug efflux pump subunit AcrB
VLSTGSGGTVRIGDVAQVVDAAAPRQGDALIMGRPGVLMTLSSQYGANTLQTTRNLEAALAEVTPALTAAGVRSCRRCTARRTSSKARWAGSNAIW